MPSTAKSRVFSELLAEEGSSFLDGAPRTKRRKVGLNTRFDRMVEAMNVSYRSPSKSNSSRQRSSSASASSGYGVPQTPVDAYDGLQVGALGQDFSLIKMRNGAESELEDEDTEVSLNTNCTAPSLPPWLSDTFSTLSKKHPLRLLLPNSRSEHAKTTHGNDSHDEAEGVFAFTAPPTPAISATLLNQSPVLKSPIAFYERHHPTAEVPHSYASSSSDIIEPFSKPGFASSISQPVIPKSHVSLSPEFLPAAHYPNGTQIMSFAHEHRSPDAYSWISPSQDRPIVLRATDSARAPSLLASLSPDPPIDRYPTDSSELYAKRNADVHIYAPEPAPLLPEPPQCFPTDPSDPYSGYAEYDVDDVDTIPDTVLPHLHAFSTPGPVYTSSRPVYFDYPADDPSSDPPDPAYELDYSTLDFQWTPFDRKTTAQPTKTQRRFHSELALPGRNLIPDDIGSLPPSSDRPSADENIPAGLQSVNSGSDRELPLASSSDGLPNDEEQLMLVKQGPEAGSGAATEDTSTLMSRQDKYPTEESVPSLPSPSPFRFTPPSRTPSLTNTIVPDNNKFEPTSFERPLIRSPTTPAVAFTPSSSNYVFRPPTPIEVKDLHALKNNLLEQIDRIAPDPPKRDGKAKVHADATEGDVMTNSQDSIESWGSLEGS